MLTLLVATLLVNTPPPADRDLARAISLYENADLPRAEALLRATLNRALKSADRYTAMKYLAATHLALGNEEQAAQDVAELVALAPDESFDPKVFDPRLSEIHAKAKAEAELAAAKGTAAPDSDAVKRQDGLVPSETKVTAEVPSKLPEVSDAHETIATSRTVEVALIGSGAFIAAASGALLAVTSKEVSALRSGDPSITSMEQLSSSTTRLKSQNTLSLVGLGVGAVLAAAGAGLFIATGNSTVPTAGLSITPSGLTVTGTL